MKHNAPAFLLAQLLAVGAILSPATAGAQGSPDETARLRAEITRLKGEVQRAESDIRRTDSLAREEQAAAARNRERLARDQERRARENAAVENRLRDARARIAAERARGEGYADETGEIQSREQSLMLFFTMVADSLLTRIERGIPWDVDSRRDRVLSLRRDLETGAATPEEAFARLAALFREETKAGDEATLSSRPLTRQNGEVVNAQILKIGNQAMVYVDDEGKKFGVLEPREPRVPDSASVRPSWPIWKWREDLSLSERAAVRRAVAVKAGREPPQLTPLPVPLAGLNAGRTASQRTPNAAPDTEGGR